MNITLLSRLRDAEHTGKANEHIVYHSHIFHFLYAIFVIEVNFHNVQPAILLSCSRFKFQNCESENVFNPICARSACRVSLMSFVQGEARTRCPMLMCTSHNHAIIVCMCGSIRCHPRRVRSHVCNCNKAFPQNLQYHASQKNIPIINMEEWTMSFDAIAYHCRQW